MDPKKRSIDKAAQEMIALMAERGQQNAWDRLDAQGAQCGFGKQGICCRICAMGPCRVTKKAPHFETLTLRCNARQILILNIRIEVYLWIQKNVVLIKRHRK